MKLKNMNIQLNDAIGAVIAVFFFGGLFSLALMKDIFKPEKINE